MFWRKTRKSKDAFLTKILIAESVSNLFFISSIFHLLIYKISYFTFFLPIIFFSPLNQAVFLSQVEHFSLLLENKKCITSLYMHVKSLQSYLIPCNPMDCCPWVFFVHGILQARILEWVAIRFSRRIFPIQGSNSCLLRCRRIFYQLSHQGSPLEYS